MGLAAPTGVLTLMFTDIEDSTALWERMGDSFRPVLDRHNQLIREILSRWDGYEVKSQGDSFMVAFQRSTDAVHCALDVQRALAEEGWPGAVQDLLVRIGIHTGEPFLGYDAGGRPDYFGPMVNRAARLAAAGHGGQILISSATGEVVQGALPGDVQLLDLGRHRLRGLELPEHLFEVRHPELPQRSCPPLRTLDAVRTNLPVQLTTFVGREKELTDLRELSSRPETRLLTLTGPGGAGKTRLAHELASELADRFGNGAWWVSLGEIGSPDDVLPSVAAAAQLTLLPNRDAREQLISFLADRELLLVLDSFERAIGASLLVADILKSAPRVRCLVTSQIALRLRGEQEYAVPPLRAAPIDHDEWGSRNRGAPLQLSNRPEARRLPIARRASDARLPVSDLRPEHLLRLDAVALFVVRARAVRAEFALTAGNATVVAEICRRLDGLPLAIELAAAQVAEMSVAEILHGLESRLDDLWSESPDVPERHRTLRAALDWSYCLLDETGRQALVSFSFFSGGWTRDAAEAVAGTEALAALRTLRRHSLLNVTESAEGHTRYFLLETIRGYARLQRGADPATGEAAAERHARYYLVFAEARAGLMRSRDEARAVDELGEEIDNLRAAMDSTRRSGPGDLSARLALGLYELLYRRGFWEEARWRVAEALSLAGHDEGSRDLRAALNLALANLASEMGDREEARRHAEASLAIHRDLVNHRGVVEALNALGSVAMDAGESDVARQRFQEALSLLTDPDPAWHGILLHNLAHLASRRGETHQARHLYEEALCHRRAAGDARGEAETLGDLGAIAHNAGDLPAARRLYHESLALYQALCYPYGVAITLNNLGELAEAEGKLESSIGLFVHAERILRDLQAAHAAVPTGHLQRLRQQLGADRFAELRAAPEHVSWEDLAVPGAKT
jgi:predicted ATPase/class 3 adenylate cyclase/Flp pilus assembly protein TadD